MTRQDPDAVRPGDTREPGTGTVWEGDVPWQSAPLDTAGEPGAAPARDSAPATDGEDEESLQKEPSGRTGPVRPVLAAAVGLSCLLLVVPVVLLHDSGPGREPRAAHSADSKETPYAQPSPSTTVQSSPAAPPRRTGSPSPAPSHHAADTVTTPSATPTRRTTPEPASPAPRPAAAPRPTETVVNGTSVLERGQSWSTGRAELALLPDGNLVLYDGSHRPLWWTGTAGEGARAVFQADGNLVVYTRDMRPLWSSRTDGHDGAHLVLRSDGKAAIRYGDEVLWSL
ncbi:hypothetical protein ACFQMH_31680 [Streptomyces viridiviolaceus]|uniref:Bulb-type lectin domain-containing protein n=1 Tax=Streptomyces viridiviolaceus TaxID=68282 RepID=A0ABW2EA94_9ACTN|nr:hypothetical protein [Streptomyces viridiviolaceus]